MRRLAQARDRGRVVAQGREGIVAPVGQGEPRLAGRLGGQGEDRGGQVGQGRVAAGP